MQISEAVGAGLRTVSHARADLIKAGFIQASVHDHTTGGTRVYAKDLDTPPRDQEIVNSARESRYAPRTPSREPPTSANELLEQATDDLMAIAAKEAAAEGAQIKDLAPDEMKRILSRIARNRGIAPQIIIAAIAAKAKLDFDTTERDELGPGPPLTEEDAISRLTLMLTAVGPKLALAAMDRVLGVANAPSNQASPPNGAAPPTSPA